MPRPIVPIALTWITLALAGCGGREAERHEPAATTAGRESEPAPEASEAPAPSEPTVAVAASAPEPTCVAPEAEPSCEGVAAPTVTLQQLRDEDAARRRARSATRPRSRDDESPRPLEPEEAARASELRAHLCAMPAGDAERPAVLYQLARVHYDALDVATAAPMFDRVAAVPGELAGYATDLALDSLVLRMRQGIGPAAAAECESRMRTIVDRALASCAPRPMDEERCARMSAIRTQLDARAP